MLKPESLEQMWTPQFAAAGAKSGFGIGFHINDLEGHRRVGHGGAIYGFATELDLLPDDKLGVVVVAARDCANAVVEHIADVALEHLLAVRQEKLLPKIEETTALPPEQARRLAGRYRSGDKEFDLSERGGRLWLLPARGVLRMEVRALGNSLMIDDRLDHGRVL